MEIEMMVTPLENVEKERLIDKNLKTDFTFGWDHYIRVLDFHSKEEKIIRASEISLYNHHLKYQGTYYFILLVGVKMEAG